MPDRVHAPSGTSAGLGAGPGRAVTLAAALLMLAPGIAQAASVWLQVQSRPGLTFNREAPSVVTVRTPWGRQDVKLGSGTLYSSDPEHYWSALDPVLIRVRVPASVTDGSYPVSAQTEFYVCDQQVRLCSVRPAEAHGELKIGRAAPELTLTLSVPQLRRFGGPPPPPR